VRWTPACEDVSPGAEVRSMLEDIPGGAAKAVAENTGLCVIVICKVQSRVV
jgi:hypothetical protein